MYHLAMGIEMVKMPQWVMLISQTAKFFSILSKSNPNFDRAYTLRQVLVAADNKGYSAGTIKELDLILKDK